MTKEGGRITARDTAMPTLPAFNPLPAIGGTLAGCLTFWSLYLPMTDLMQATTGPALSMAGMWDAFWHYLGGAAVLSMIGGIPSVIVCVGPMVVAAFLLHRLRDDSPWTWMVASVLLGFLLGNLYFGWLWNHVSEQTDQQSGRRFIFFMSLALSSSALGGLTASILTRCFARWDAAP